MSSPIFQRNIYSDQLPTPSSSMQQPRDRSSSMDTPRFIRRLAFFNSSIRKEGRRQSYGDSYNQLPLSRGSLEQELLREEIISPPRSFSSSSQTMTVSVPRKETTTTESSSSSSTITTSRRSTGLISIRYGSRRRTFSVNTVMSEDSTGNDAAATVVRSSDESSENIVLWLQNSCPMDVVPKVLAFCGPQTVASLSRTNKKWNRIIKQESTWQIMSEELYKWKIGDDIPLSWFDFYCTNPCVPIDFTSVHTAVAVANEIVVRPYRRSPSMPLFSRQVRSVRVLLRPGTYYLKNSVDVNAIPGAKITFETMEMPTNVFVRPKSTVDDMVLTTSTAPEKAVPTKIRRRSLRSFLRCVRTEIVDESTTEDLTDVGQFDIQDSTTEPPKIASLVFRSRHHNEPVFHVYQGILTLHNIEIHHNSNGTDIWNGNAAIQIQPQLGENNIPILAYPRPTAVLDKVLICSRSGRGIVNIDGGSITIRDSMVRDCAATGIYVGGPGGEAIVERTDVIRNGVGNRTSRRGVSRGHSGIYLEQGTAWISDSNVSNNTLTGISVVSPENAFITLQDSDLMSNGTFQLELPQLNSVSRQKSEVKNNRMIGNGEGQVRSGFSSQVNDTPLPERQRPAPVSIG